MKQQLSAASTRFWKMTFPLCLSLFLGGIILWALFFTSEHVPLAVQYQLAATWLATTGLLVLLSWPLKEVARDDANLYVQTRDGEISIPLSQIAWVTQNSWVHFGDKHPIVIRFSTPTPVGEKITFLPQGKGMNRALRKSPIHPLVEELQKSAGRTQIR